MSFDFDAAVVAPFRMQPGLRRLAAGAPQLTPLAPGSRAQREKLAVLSAFAPQALLCQPGFDAAAALQALAAHAAAEHPDTWTWDGRRAVSVRLGTAATLDGAVEQVQAGVFGLGDEVARCLAPLAPEWRLAGLLCLSFAEDLALIDLRSGAIPWLAVALPSFWAPETKVGRHFTEVHAPVADNALLLRATDSLVKLVGGPQRWERFVWTVTSHRRLHAHPARVAADRWPGEAGAELPAGAWWRSERQTFIPLPDLTYAAFTILVDTEPLASAIHSPSRARALQEAVATMSPAVLAYRSLAEVRAPLLAWLASVAGP